ncbi:MAG: serine hydrolase [Nodosilinea sp.]
MAQFGDPDQPSPPGFYSYHGSADAAGQGVDPAAPMDDNGSGPSWDLGPQSPLSPAARQRNQWRQHRHLTPDFGAHQPPSEEPVPVARPSRHTALPNFAPLPPVPQGRGPQPQPQPQPQFPEPAPPAENPMRSRRGPHQPPLQMHPHSTSLDAAMPEPRPGRAPSLGSGHRFNDKVTPLRRRPQPPHATAAAAQAAALAPTGAPLVPGPVTNLNARRVRPVAPRRRLAKPPLPLLYLIRMVILGVGVAAIAGTLLSVLSPTNVVSSAGEAEADQGELAVTGSLVQGSATTVADIRLEAELTRLKAQLEQLATLTPGLTPAVYAIDLDSGRYVDLNGGEAVPAASTIKVPILVAFLQQVDAGNIALNQSLTLQEDQVAAGSGTLRNDPVGTEYTALEVATRMIVSSDNTATNMMITALGGIDALNATFSGWGLGATLIRNPLPDLEGTNTTSAKDLALIMALIDQGGVLSPRSRDRMFSIMQRTANRTLIPAGINDSAIVANKTGDVAAMLGDVALIDTPNGQRYGLAVLVQRPDNDGRASELIRRMTESTHSEINQPVAPVGGAAPVPNGAEGQAPGGVEEPVPDGVEGTAAPMPMIDTPEGSSETPDPVEVSPNPPSPSADDVPQG